MRQARREIIDPAGIEAVIQAAEVCRLGLTDGLWPYIVPLNFGYADQRLYFHCAPAGFKLDLLRKNDRVCFELESVAEIERCDDSACRWNTRFKSVIGLGRARLVVDPAEKRRALDVIMAHYSGRSGWTYGEGPLEKMVVIRVDIERMTGKQSKHFVAPE